MMNGINKLKICKTNGRNEENGDEDVEEDIDVAQPSTSRAGLLDEPKWNTSTRQIYEDNLKSTSSSTARKCETSWTAPVARERVPSVTDSTSSDDSCVYMYKGDGSQRNGNDVNKRVNCSSPEMDYLEMDFDPCQSNGHDSSDGSYSCDVGDLKEDENNGTFCGSTDQERNSTPTNVDSRIPSPRVDQELNLNSESPQPSTSKIDLNKIPLGLVDNKPECSKVFTNLKDQGPKNDCNLDHELELAETEEINSTLLSHRHTAPNNLACCISNINRAMCFMYGLGATLKDEEKLQELLLNSEITYPSDMPITEFLNEMSKGLVTIPVIQDSIDKIFGGTVTSKFFTPYPRTVNLSSWLQCWTKRGAAVLLCLNFHLTDANCNCTVNPSWHYQLVFSTTSMGIHITHEDMIHENTLKKLLTNPSDVWIHRDAVMAHWNPHSDLVPLFHTSDHSWKQYNVLGQVVNIIRETVTGKSDDEIRYVKIPSNQKPGILILMRSDNIHIPELLAFEGFSIQENTQN